MTTETPTSTSDDREEGGLSRGLRAALAVAAIAQPTASAESVVRQTNYFPMFKDGGPHLGQLYTKVWKAPFVEGVTDEWAQRVAGYWERLEIKYGVIWSRPVIDYDKETGTIVTAATPIALVPGERYEVQG